jgi:TonB-dependent SusC/RagA subfamily outer membrane receptor
MAILIAYLIKLSISLAVVYVFYQLLLRRLTFYNWNRWYLLAYSVVAFFIPFVNIYPVLEKNNWSSHEMIEMIPVVGFNEGAKLGQAKPWGQEEWAAVFIATGVLIMLVRLAIQQLSFRRIVKNSTLLHSDKVKIYQVDKNIIPFSFGNSIFINQHQHSSEELTEIIRHEFIHVKQKHTIDILWSEALVILNWYNPFAWLLRRSIRQNLEFIADHKVLENGIDKKDYQYLLLKVVGISHFSVAANFNFSSLKKRIAMMNKIRSAKLHLVKFLFLLPLMAVMLLAFRNNLANEQDEPAKQQPVNQQTTGLTVDTLFNVDKNGNITVGNMKHFEDEDVNGNRFMLMVDGKEVSTVQNIHKSKIVFIRSMFGKEARAKYGNNGRYGVYEFYTIDAPAEMIDTLPGRRRLPENVSSISITNDKATVKLKNGTIETYDLSKADEEAAFEKKYGRPAPPPPAPVPPAVHHDPPAPPEPPHPVKDHVRWQPGPNDKGYIITVADNHGECVIIVKDKNNKLVKAVELTEWNKSEKEYVAKYGEIPPPPKVVLREPAKPVAPAKPKNPPSPPAAPAAPKVPPPGVDDGIIIAPSGNQHLLKPTPATRSLQALSPTVRITGIASVSDPIIFIDGVQQPKDDEGWKKIDPNTIESIHILKDQSATALYGETARHGVIFIVTKKNSSSAFARTGEMNLDIETFEGLVYLDGQQLTRGTIDSYIKAENIESINILKNDEAVKLYGEKGRKGVILITSKKRPQNL